MLRDRSILRWNSKIWSFSDIF